MNELPKFEIWGAGTMRTLRPVWTAEELGLNYRHVPIGPRTGETQTEEYTRLNPKQKVPCLVDGELVISESVAISRYLIARYGDKSTITAPKRLEMRAKEDEWVSYFYGELDETSLYVMRRHGALAPIYGEAPQAVASARAYASRHLSVIATHLKDRNFVVGDRFGLADIILVSCLDWAVRYDFDLGDSLLGYRDSITKREAYRKACAINYSERKGG